MIAPADAVAAIRARTKTAPKIAVILGSGLGALAAEVAGATRIPYGDVPGWQRSTAPGHAGELVVGRLEGKDVAVMSGRLHYYEGYDIAAIGFPVRVLRAWGVDTLVITNACGGLNPSFVAGDLMVINDHINFMGANPLRGPNDDRLGPRFPDMVGTYTEALRELAHSVDHKLREGVYVAVAGPNYETPAELLCICADHVREARAELRVVRPAQRVGAHEVDVVVDHHEVARLERGVEAAARVGEDHSPHAPRTQDADRKRDRLHVVALVVMKPSAHDGDILRGERADHELSGVTGRGAAPKSRDVAVRDPRRVLNVLR